MIPYEDLVAALASWRARNGLPTITADALFASPTLAPLGGADGAEFVEMTEGIVEELDAADHLIEAEEDAYEDAYEASYEASYEGETYDEPVEGGDDAATGDDAYESDAIAAELAADVDYDLGDDAGEVVYEAASDDEATAYGADASADEVTAYADGPAEDPATVGDEGFADDEHTAFGGPADDMDMSVEIDAAVDAGALIEEELDAGPPEPPPAGAGDDALLADDGAMPLDEATRVGGDFAELDEEATSLAAVPGELDDDDPASS